MDATETDDESLIGEECHIIARRPDGPRGNAGFPEGKLDTYENLILLCRIHHKIIDDQPNMYSAEYLKEIKAAHEKWIRESLSGYDPQKQKDEELYASYVDTWFELAHVDNWNAWSSHILASDLPQLWVDVDMDLSNLRTWIFSRIWPQRYLELEDAFENFRRVLQDFQNTFHRYSEQAEDTFYTKKFYQIDEWNEKNMNTYLENIRFT